MASGACVLLESPGRRLELALYVLPRAIESAWNVAVENGKVRSIPNGEVFVFMAGTGLVCTLFQHDPESVDDGYRKVITRFLGVN